jgi:DNA-binding GntR family transcriptional regulator
MNLAEDMEGWQPASESSREPTTASEGAVALVWREVLRGLYETRYSPGQRLTEAELTRTFGVSRSSVREALSRLAAEGVVTINRHRGATIRLADTKELFDALDLLQIMSGYAARMAATRISQGDNVDLAKALLARLRPAPFGLAPFALAREQNNFYRTLLKLAGNSELQRLMPLLHIHYLRIMLNSAQSSSQILQEYCEVIDAILSGNRFDAERCMKDHVARHIDLLQQVSSFRA